MKSLTFVLIYLMSTVCLAAENTAIRLIVPWPAGSTIDLTARYLQPSLEKSLNSRVLVENRPGANGQVAVEYSLQRRDSTIFILDQMNQYLNPLLQPKLNYDPNRDLLPLALVSELNFVLVVNPRVPAKNLKELIALARARPGGRRPPSRPRCRPRSNTCRRRPWSPTGSSPAPPAGCLPAPSPERPSLPPPGRCSAAASQIGRAHV